MIIPRDDDDDDDDDNDDDDDDDDDDNDDNDEDEDDDDDDENDDGEDDNTISRYSLNGSSWQSVETIEGEVFWDMGAVLGVTVFCVVLGLLQVTPQKCTVVHSTAKSLQCTELHFTALHFTALH